MSKGEILSLIIGGIILAGGLLACALELQAGHGMPWGFLIGILINTALFWRAYREERQIRLTVSRQGQPSAKT